MAETKQEPKVDIDRMPAGTALDALVAEKVMGWTQVGDVWGVPFRDGYYQHKANWNWSPTIRADDDYEVLQHVRENWLPSQIKLFQEYLLLVLYEPGDYGRAALKVLEYDVKTAVDYLRRLGGV